MDEDIEKDVALLSEGITDLDERVHILEDLTSGLCAQMQWVKNILLELHVKEQSRAEKTTSGTGRR